MTQELIDLRTSILEGRYADALAIVDELEGMINKQSSVISNLSELPIIPKSDHWTILEVLTTFVREQTSLKAQLKEKKTGGKEPPLKLG
jgi:hypothetical protein